MSRLFKALGDDTRLRIVALLSHGELCVCHVQDALGLTQPNGQPDSHCGRQLEALVRSFASQGTLKKDVERLVKVRGPAACR